MGDKDLISALTEQTQIMSDTYSECTKRMCDTMEKLNKSSTVLFLVIIGIVLAIIIIVFVFLLVLYLF